MSKFFVLIVVSVLLSCSFLATKTLGFQSSFTTTTTLTRSRRNIYATLSSRSTFVSTRSALSLTKSRRRRAVAGVRIDSDPAAAAANAVVVSHSFTSKPPRRHGSSIVCLHMLNSNNGFPNPRSRSSRSVSIPPQTKRNVWIQRLPIIVMDTVKQFVSGFMSGYVMGSIWSLLRRGVGAGAGAAGANRGMVWGLDLGVLSALFSGTNSIREFILTLWNTKSQSSDNSSNNNKDGMTTKQSDKNSDASSSLLMKRQQKASLWTVVIRNMILAMYFGRNRGIVGMTRWAVFYGGLTYYFVGNKLKRDDMMMMMRGRNGGGGGFGGRMGNTSSPSAESMQQLMQQIMSLQQQGQQSRTTSQQRPKSTSPGSSASSSSSSSSSTTTQTPSSFSKSKNLDDAVDVEFEKVDADTNDTNNNDTNDDALRKKVQPHNNCNSPPSPPK